jgi:hypothetical protein
MNIITVLCQYSSISPYETTVFPVFVFYSEIDKVKGRLHALLARTIYSMGRTLLELVNKRDLSLSITIA